MNFWQSIIQWISRGRNSDWDSDDWLITMLCYTGMLITAILGILMIFPGDYPYVYMNAFTFAFCYFIIFLNKKGYYRESAITFSLVMALIIFSYSIFFGHIGSENFLFIGSITGIYFLRKYKSYGPFIFIICVILFVSAKFIQWKYLEVIEMNTYQAILMTSNIVFTFTILFVISRLVENTHEKEREQFINLSDSRGKLLSVLSHDMRGPVHTLQALTSEALQKNLSEKDTKRVINDASDRISSVSLMMENTLVWIKKQMNGIEINKEKINICEIISKNVKVFTFASERKGVPIECHCDQQYQINTDPDIIDLALRNLISNAIKHSYPGKGKITIGIEENAQKLWISVEDKGEGIEKSQLKNLFNDTHTTPGTDNEKGYGLGLVIVKDFLEAMGEEINVSSKKGEGSKFFFSVNRN